MKTLDEVVKNMAFKRLDEIVKTIPELTAVTSESPSLDEQSRDFTAKFASELVDGFFCKAAILKSWLT